VPASISFPLVRRSPWPCQCAVYQFSFPPSSIPISRDAKMHKCITYHHAFVSPYQCGPTPVIRFPVTNTARLVANSELGTRNLSWPTGHQNFNISCRYVKRDETFSNLSHPPSN
jgi:hypothetical protein